MWWFRGVLILIVDASEVHGFSYENRLFSAFAAPIPKTFQLDTLKFCLFRLSDAVSVLNIKGLLLFSQDANGRSQLAIREMKIKDQIGNKK